MKYEVRFTAQFKKDLKLAKKQGKDTEKLFAVIEKQKARTRGLEVFELRPEIAVLCVSVNDA